MNYSDCYLRANQQKPGHADGIAAEAKRLTDNHYSTSDIARCLQLDRIAIERMLQTNFHHSLEIITTQRKSSS